MIRAKEGISSMRAMIYAELAALFVGACVLSGCSAAQPSPEGDSNEALSLAAQLRDVPGCSDVDRPSSSVRLTARRFTTDLYLVEELGAPLCVDDAQGVEALSSNVVMTYAASDPMPGRDPSQPAASDPMPGRDPSQPASSDPMPGTSTSGTSGTSGPR
jgi:hypothetical protein